MTRVSLKDVAARAGVSFQTTSKVLNGQGTVASETRQRILRAASELGYVPNALARSLSTRRSCTMGLIASTGGDTVLSLCIGTIERTARQCGQAVILGSIAPDGHDGEEVIRSLLSRQVEGLLIVAPQLESQEQIGELIARRVPAVSTHPMPAGISSVQTDFYRAAVLAVEHLMALGHQRIGTITGPMWRSAARFRLDGYREALTRAGLSFDPALVEEADWEIEGGYAATHRLLDRMPNLTAIYAQNDLMAVGVLSALHDRGLRVPDQCSVVGCDDLPFAAHTIPPLTTAIFPLQQMTQRAVSLLLKLIRNPEMAPIHERLPVSLVVRQSTAPPPDFGRL